MESDWSTSNDLEELVLLTYANGVAEELPRANIIEHILKLAGKRWKEASRYIPRMEFDEDDEFYGCQTNDYGDVIDPITMEEIPRGRLISFSEGGKKWCFDIESLFEYTERGRFENPLTRSALPASIIARLKSYKGEKLVHIQFTVEGKPFNYSFDFIEGFSQVELIVEIFRTLSASTGGDPSSVDLLARYFVQGITNMEDAVTTPKTLTLTLIKVLREHLDYARSLYFAVKNRYSLTSFLGSAQKVYHYLLLRFAPGMTFIELTRYATGDGPLVLLLPFPADGRDYVNKLLEKIKEIKPLPEKVFLDVKIGLPTYGSEATAFLVWCAKKIINSSTDSEVLVRAFQVRMFYGDTPSFEEMDKKLSYARIAEVYKETSHILLTANVSLDFKKSEFYAIGIGATSKEQVQEIVYFMNKRESQSTDSDLLVSVFALLQSVDYFEAIRDRVSVEELYKTISDEELEDVYEILSYADKLKLSILVGYNPFSEDFDFEDFVAEIDALGDPPKVDGFAFYPYLENVEELRKYASSNSLAIVKALFTSLASHLEEVEVYADYIRDLLKNKHLKRATKIEILRDLILESSNRDIYKFLSVDYIIDVYDPYDGRFISVRPKLNDDEIRDLSIHDFNKLKIAIAKALVTGYEVYKLFLNTRDLRLIELMQGTYLEMIDSMLLFQTLFDKYELNLVKDSNIYTEVRSSSKLQQSFLDFCKRRNLDPAEYNVLSGIGLQIMTLNYLKSVMGERKDWNDEGYIKEIITLLEGKEIS